MDARATYNDIAKLPAQDIPAALAAVDHKALEAQAEAEGYPGGLCLARQACEERLAP